MNLQRIFVYSRPEARPLDACAARLVELLRALGSLSDALTFRLSAQTAAKASVKASSTAEPLDSRRACADALASAESVGNLGDDQEVRAFDLRLVSRPSKAMVARLRVVMGLAVDLTPIGRGNRVELALQLPGQPDPEMTLDILIALAQATEADWGFAGGKEVPFVPSNGPGTPAVGWMTFLSQRRQPVGPVQAPARVVPIGDGGIVIVAQPEAFVEARAEDLARIQAVRDALGPAVLQLPPLVSAPPAAQPGGRPPP